MGGRGGIMQPSRSGRNRALKNDRTPFYCANLTLCTVMRHPPGERRRNRTYVQGSSCLHVNSIRFVCSAGVVVDIYGLDVLPKWE